jgi:hypothetical protein
MSHQRGLLLGIGVVAIVTLLEIGYLASRGMEFWTW